MIFIERTGLVRICYFYNPLCMRSLPNLAAYFPRCS